MRFGGVVAVDNVDFSLAEGDLRCIIGPNGAGKSTFFKCLTRQYTPTSGSILFRGEDITRKETHEVARRGLGIKTQVPSVMDGITTRENVWIAASRIHRGPSIDKTVDATLARLSLTGVGDDLVGQLSHGLRQWVELAMVLASEPVLILLDEPTAGMTHDEIYRSAELIREINRSAALIVVEHDMQFIKAIASTVTVFHQGAVLVEDEMSRVMQDSRVRDVYLGKKRETI